MNKQAIEEHSDAVTALAKKLGDDMALSEDSFAGRLATLKAATKIYSAVLIQQIVQKLIGDGADDTRKKIEEGVGLIKENTDTLRNKDDENDEV